MSVAMVEAPKDFRIVRSWRGCEATVTSENGVTLTTIPDRVAGMFAESQLMGNPMPLSEAHAKAEKLNKIQIAGGFLDWLHSPIPVGAGVPEYDQQAFDNLVKNY